MALTKTPININFSKGLDTKTDPKQVPIGKFVDLQNSVFTKEGLLQKRNGFELLAALPDDTSTYSSTFNGNLVAIGSSISAYSNASRSWYNKGALQPLLMDSLPLVRSNTNQSQADSVVSSNGLVCTVYTDNITSGTTTVASYRYVIADAVTGQNIIPPTVISAPSGTITGSPRVFILGNFFIVVFSNNVSGTYHLQYIAISIVNPATPTTAVDLTTQYTPNSRVAWDGYVANNSLYVAWNGSDGGGAIRMLYITSTLSVSSPIVYAGATADMISVTADQTGSTPVIYVSTGLVSGTGVIFSVTPDLSQIFAPTALVPNTYNITSSAKNGICTVIYEVPNSYSYNPSILTNAIRKVDVTAAGSVGSSSVLVRGVGLASKSFVVDEVIYFSSVYSTEDQPTYFVMDSDSNIIAKIAYSNGGGYLETGLPSAVVVGNVVSFAYLIKDFIAPVNKELDADSTSPIYTQTGINLVTLTIGTSNISTAELGNNLHMSGGIVWAYDGYQAVEQGFNVWPDYVEGEIASGGGAMTNQEYQYVATYEWSDNQGNIFRSAPSIPVSVTTTTLANKNFTDANVNVGANEITVAAHGFNTGTQFTISNPGTLPTPLAAATQYYVIVVNANVIKIASSLTNALAGTAIVITNAGSGTNTMTVTANTSSVVVHVPTLRLTYKVANPVKIVIYRWSVAQPTFYQVTSVTAPLLNSTAVDSVQFVDSLADTSIIGNSILYTTGGVVENIGPPAASSHAIFKSRVILVSAEDKDVLWYSKQVVQSSPVEFSDLFTIYTAATTSTQGGTGPTRCITAMDDKLIMFKDNEIFYLVGNGPDVTGANNDFSEPIFITSTVGCANQQSIVFMPQGLMFQSSKGIWLLSRDLSTTYVGAPVEDFNEYEVLSAVNVPATNQVRFTLSNGVLLVYDYFFGQWGTFTGIPAVSSTIYENLHTFINANGEAYQENVGSYLDGSRPVLMSFKTGPINIAGVQGFQRAYYFYFIGEYVSPHRLSLSMSYDYNPNPSQTSIVTPENFNLPYGGDPFYGSYSYGGNPSLEQWQVYFQKQKCQAIQIELQESFDASLGESAGAGFTLSGLNVIVGVKDGEPRLKAATSVG